MAADARATRLHSLAAHLSEHLKADLTLRLWDGSEIPLGPDAKGDLAIAIRSPQVVTKLVRSPKQPTLIEAIATGDIAIEGGTVGIYQTLATKRARGLSGLPLTRADWYR